MNTPAAFKLSFAVSLLGLAISAMPAYGQVAPGIQLKDGLGNIVTINSQGVVTYGGICTALTCTTAASIGIENTNGEVGWAGTIGSFSLTAIGETAPLRTGINDLNISGLTTTLGGTLTVLFTVTNVDGEGPYSLSQSSNFSGGGSVTYTSYADTTNTPFGTGTNLDPSGMTITSTSSSAISVTGPSSHAMSITNSVVLTALPLLNFTSDYFTANSTNTPLAVACASGSATAGVAYSSMLTASGGVPSYVYSIVGSLPAGLSLNASTGAIAGTPSTQGTFAYTAQVTDSSGSTSADTATASCSMTISPPATPLSLSCSGTTGQVGTPYSSNLVAAGGTGKGYMYSIISGSLPTSLQLNGTTGFITGTPTAAGGFTFTAQVTDTGDSAEAPVSKSCTVTIAPPPSLTLTCPAVTSGTVGSAYSSSFGATGGTSPYTYSIISGGLPTGLTFNTTSGAISGTPTASGTYPFTFQAVDSSTNKTTGSLACSIGIINAQIAPLSVSCPTATATVGVAYNSTVPVVGGVSPYTYSVSTGSLPAGLTLNTSTGAITGTPTTAGTSGFTITVVDSKGTTAKSSCTGTCASGSTTSLNFNSPTGNLGTSHVYVVSGVSITAHGYTNAGSATSIDGQNNSGVQDDGLGIASVSNGQIDTNNFVQLDLSAAIAAGATNGQLLISGINQCQNGESYDVYGSNTLGSVGTLLVSAGTNNSTYFAIPSFGTYKYISVRAHSGNVLIGDIQFTLPGPTCSIAVAAPPTPKISLKKTANVTSVNPFQDVTYTYVVTNTGSYTLTNVVVTDDNATPSYTGDDFTVGTIASLLPGASATLTATVIPPVTECATPQSFNGWGNGGGNSWGNSNSSPGGTLICSKTSTGNYKVTFLQDPSQTDNTYGRGSSSIWSGQSRTFAQMLSGQAAEFQFLDSHGNCVLDVAADYISKSSSFPSGYGSLGISGGNGSVISGKGSNVVSCTTTLSHNLNQSSSFYGCTTDSPSSSSWNNTSGYTLEVNGECFGSAGFGGVAIPECHNQNSAQQGCNDTHVSPTSSSATNTATATATGNGLTVTATAQATVQINASSSSWSQCSKY